MAAYKEAVFSPLLIEKEKRMTNGEKSEKLSGEVNQKFLGNAFCLTL